MAAKKPVKTKKDSNTTENVILMKQARETLKGRWTLAVGTFLLYFLISVAISAVPKIGFIISLILSGPLTLGIVIFFLNFSRNQEAKLEQIFLGFKNFGTSFIAYILVVVFTILWALLLIIPGIIAAFSYSMTFYIIADDKSIDASAAIKKSKKMMYGYKWKLFCLYCRFIGWALLSILTLGIGFLWLCPYISVSVAKFYDDVKEKYASETSA
jgi:uncharacterized membrane protein